MAYTSGSSQNEILKLQSEITSEVTGDAATIARGVFGDNKNHPDMAQVSNQQLDELYRSKYLTNDRAWLQAEAKRDPQQFLDVAQRIGVTVQPQAPGTPPGQSAVPDMNAFAKTAQAAPVPMPALTPAGPVAPPGLPPAGPVPPMSPAALPVPPTMPPAPPPVILGPNGQPLTGQA